MQSHTRAVLAYHKRSVCSDLYITASVYILLCVYMYMYIIDNSTKFCCSPVLLHNTFSSFLICNTYPKPLFSDVPVRSTLYGLVYIFKTFFLCRYNWFCYTIYIFSGIFDSRPLLLHSTLQRRFCSVKHKE